MGHSDDPILRASEVGHYAFCARAWWLGRVKGYRSANVAALRHGQARHLAHGQAVAGYHRLRRVAIWLLLAATLLFAAWLLLTVMG